MNRDPAQILIRLATVAIFKLFATGCSVLTVGKPDCLGTRATGCRHRRGFAVDRPQPGTCRTAQTPLVGSDDRAEGVNMASEGYHEPVSELSDATRDMHRAVVSLMEELEAVDWYNQRVDACKDPVLRAILAHNRDEEKEHASMLLEWIRRTDGTFDKELRDYLFTDKPLTHD
jgi:ferritin-like protein